MTTSVHCIYLSVNPILHARTQYIKLDYHYIRERVALDTLETRYATSLQQLGDIITKPLLKALFMQLRIKLGIYCIPLPSLKGSIRKKIKDFTLKDHEDIVML